MSNYDETNYPPIDIKLIEALNTDFPDKLPTRCVDEFELGKLIGQQEVIKKLDAERVSQEESGE